MGIVFINHEIIVGFLRGGYSRGGGNWGTLRIPFGKIGVHLKGTLGKIRGITSPLKNPIKQRIPG